MPQNNFRENSSKNKIEPFVGTLRWSTTKPIDSDTYNGQETRNHEVTGNRAHHALSAPNYFRSKIFLVIFCSIFMMIGGPTFLYGIFYFFQGLAGTRIDFKNLFFIVWGGGFFFGGLYLMTSKLRELSTFERMTYTWYRSQYPDHVRGGKVSCFVCGNPRVHARALMNKTYHREHFCTQCGKTLYYSPERS